MIEPHAGMVYTSFMAQLIGKRAVETYLEIGVENGHCLACMSVDRAIGVDPAFKLTADPTAGKRALELHRVTSDVFFRQQPASLNLDFAFLDGLHVFEYLLRDIYNVERHCKPESLIAIHDALPFDARMISRENTGGAWTGDIWKVIPILEKYRPDIRIVLVDCKPTGLVFLTDLDPNSITLRDNYLQIVGEFRDMPNTHEELERFYQDRQIVAAGNIISGFNHTLYFKV